MRDERVDVELVHRRRVRITNATRGVRRGDTGRLTPFDVIRRVAAADDSRTVEAALRECVRTLNFFVLRDLARRDAPSCVPWLQTQPTSPVGAPLPPSLAADAKAQPPAAVPPTGGGGSA